MVDNEAKQSRDIICFYDLRFLCGELYGSLQGLLGLDKIFDDHDKDPLYKALHYLAFSLSSSQRQNSKNAGPIA